MSALVLFALVDTLICSRIMATRILAKRISKQFGFTFGVILTRSRTNMSENVMNKYDEEAFIREMQHKHTLTKCKARPLEYRVVNGAQEVMRNLAAKPTQRRAK